MSYYHSVYLTWFHSLKILANLHARNHNPNPLAVIKTKQYEKHINNSCNRFVYCKSPSDKKTETKSIELEQLQVSIDSLFNTEIGENEPGAAILVFYDGEMIIGKGYGIRNLEGMEPI